MIDQVAGTAVCSAYDFSAVSRYESTAYSLIPFWNIDSPSDIEYLCQNMRHSMHISVKSAAFPDI